jgi:hyperosmotically inducible protein
MTDRSLEIFKMRKRPLSLLLATALAGLITMLVVGCNRPAEPTAVAAAPAAAAVDDKILAGIVKSALRADPALNHFDLDAESRLGQVRLVGTVDDAAQAEHAVTVARGVNGVHGVVDQLSLKGATAVAGNIDDLTVTTRVKTALLGDARIKSFAIAVTTTKGDVKLSGVVDNQGQIDQAMKVTRAIEGVHSIHDELTIKL